MSANWREVAAALFPQGHSITENADFLSGTAQSGNGPVCVVGTTGHTPLGIEIALLQAQAILHTVRQYPRRPILIMVDTQGQRLRHRDEMLGINSYMAHLGKCIELARQRGHRVLGLVYDQALSGGFITSGLMADACFALPGATIRVMGLPAMARITKVPEERLTALAKSNPVFAPGPENYLRMGGLLSLWDGDLAAHLNAALSNNAGDNAADNTSGSASGNAITRNRDDRAALGAERGGRNWSHRIVQAILGDTHVSPP
jgi:malonate decarboxylase gamma subunit